MLLAAGFGRVEMPGWAAESTTEKPPGVPRPVTEEARRSKMPPQGPRRSTLWADTRSSRYNSFIVAPETLLAAGHLGSNAAEEPFLAAIDIAAGNDLWRETLPAVVRAGTAADHQGRIAVTLENGQIVAFAGE